MTMKMILASATIALGCAMATSAVAQTNKAFLTTAIKGDNSEITLGQYAADHGASKGVRSFGQTLVTDHTKSKKKAMALANEMQVTPPDGTTKDAKMELKKLKDMKGKAFDQEFAQFMVTDHQKMISAFKAEAAKGNKPVPTFAKNTLPTLEKHLKIAESLTGS